ncbi:MAG: YdcF family protein [Candidatus Micrarchaeota archaeon]|nr:YdcF family protein [Candidatus Micrarchaeota archaeon]MDE1848042.1 YdcF family protein [Candidatus Micrarchaeota archaeon]MDE1864727.1 YdcF family protein [Candidatus Micrarchaeota archaeon]
MKNKTQHIILALGKKLDVTEKGDALSMRGRLVVEGAVNVYKELQRSGAEPQMLMSGGVSTRYKNEILKNLGSTPRGSEAAKMAEHARKLGVNEQIMLEEESTDRAENLILSKRILEQKFAGQDIKVHVVFDKHHLESIEALLKMSYSDGRFSYEMHPINTQIPAHQKPVEWAKEKIAVPWFKGKLKRHLSQ